MSLLSPQGIHPAPTSSLRDSPVTRKCSLIREESLEEEDGEDDDDLEIETCTDKIRASKSAENLDIDEDDSSNTSAMQIEEKQIFMKRPLLSVASSPQLLNQICEENESEEEDDFVPPKLGAARMITQRNSVASPEVIRKYEARRKHRGTGSRGTSCSSSDASDTDDTEGRSRKDKLKHKFIHRRDSSDHSSDTDGGPSGHGGGGFGRGFGGGGSGGGPSKDDNDRGGGGGKKDGKGGSPKNGRHHHHHRGKQNNLGIKLNSETLSKDSSGHTYENSVKDSVSNLSVASLTSRSSLKYVIERDENVSDSDAEDNDDNESEISATDVRKLKQCLLERFGQGSKSKHNISKHDNHSDFSSIDEESMEKFNKLIIARCSPACDMIGQHKNGHSLAMKMDINSNMFCKQNCQVEPMKIETKCCSLV